MSSSKNSRFLLSMFTAALMVFAWTGASRADITQTWVAQGFDVNMNPVNVEIDVAITQIIVDGNGDDLRDQIQITLTNFSPSASRGTSDLVLQTNNPLDSASFTGPTVPPDSVDLTLWSRAFNGNTLTLTSPTDGSDTLGSGQSASLTATTETLGMEVGGVSISTQGGTDEIAATLVPEPSSAVLATFGALGFLGYGLRRRKAK